MLAALAWGADPLPKSEHGPQTECATAAHSFSPSIALLFEGCAAMRAPALALVCV